jgi:hypothetical protein
VRRERPGRIVWRARAAGSTISSRSTIAARRSARSTASSRASTSDRSIKPTHTARAVGRRAPGVRTRPRRQSDVGSAGEAARLVGHPAFRVPVATSDETRRVLHGRSSEPAPRRSADSGSHRRHRILFTYLTSPGTAVYVGANSNVARANRGWQVFTKMSYLVRR